MHLSKVPYIKEDIEFLAHHPLFASYEIKPLDIPFEKYRPGFQGLLRILIGQQISFKAASALWLRACHHAGDEECVTPDWLLSLPEGQQKLIGLTRQKQKYAKGLAQVIKDNPFYLQTLPEVNDTIALQKITALYGFGVWSAQMYLMLCLARRNILPVNDLAVNKAIQNLYSLEKIPLYEESLKLTQEFEGKYTGFTLILWHIYLMSVKK